MANLVEFQVQPKAKSDFAAIVPKSPDLHCALTVSADCSLWFINAYRVALEQSQSNSTRELTQAPGLAIAARGGPAAIYPAMGLVPVATVAQQAKLMAAGLVTVTIIAKSLKLTTPKAGYYFRDSKGPKAAADPSM